MPQRGRRRATINPLLAIRASWDRCTSNNHRSYLTVRESWQLLATLLATVVPTILWESIVTVSVRIHPARQLLKILNSAKGNEKRNFQKAMSAGNQNAHLCFGCVD